MVNSSNEQEIFEKVVDCLENKTHPIGYYFVINEVVYPVYFDENLTPEFTIFQAWEFMCSTWLNDLYGQSVVGLLPFLMRGKVTSDSILIGNNFKFYVDQIIEVFKLPSNIELKLDTNYAISTDISKEMFGLLKNFYSHITYLNHLPWTVKFKLRGKCDSKESNSIFGDLVKQADVIAKAKQRLGKLPSME